MVNPRRSAYRVSILETSPPTIPLRHADSLGTSTMTSFRSAGRPRPARASAPPRAVRCRRIGAAMRLWIVLGRLEVLLRRTPLTRQLVGASSSLSRRRPPPPACGRCRRQGRTSAPAPPHTAFQLIDQVMIAAIEIQGSPEGRRRAVSRCEPRRMASSGMKRTVPAQQSRISSTRGDRPEAEGRLITASHG